MLRHERKRRDIRIETLLEPAEHLLGDGAHLVGHGPEGHAAQLAGASGDQLIVWEKSGANWEILTLPTAA